MLQTTEFSVLANSQNYQTCIECEGQDETFQERFFGLLEDHLDEWEHFLSDTTQNEGQKDVFQTPLLGLFSQSSSTTSASMSAFTQFQQIGLSDRVSQSNVEGSFISSTEQISFYSFSAFFGGEKMIAMLMLLLERMLEEPIATIQEEAVSDSLCENCESEDALNVDVGIQQVDVVEQVVSEEIFTVLDSVSEPVSTT